MVSRIRPINPLKEISKSINRFSPEKIKELNPIDKFKYPKLLGLVFAIILAYFVFKNSVVSDWIHGLNSLSYIGIFIAGLLFSFGFSAPFAIGFFVTLDPANLFLASIVGGFGALISDLLIFRWARFSFSDEFNLIKKTSLLKNIDKVMGFLFGQMGENKVTSVLKNHLDDSYTYIRNYKIPNFGGDIDGILITPRKIILVEVKTYTGKYKVVDGKFYKIYRNGSTYMLPRSPIEQVIKQQGAGTS